MYKKAVLAVLVASGLFWATAPAMASDNCGAGAWSLCNDVVRDRHPQGGGGDRGGQLTVVSAPEIDIAAGAKALAILVAGLLLAGEGLRRRN
jgi:hypothetical protein